MHTYNTYRHMINPLTQKLYYKLFMNGVYVCIGVLISRDMYEGIRAARYSDLPAVMDILRPLEAEGVLIARSEEQLLKDMGNCFLMVRDGAVLACGEYTLHTHTHQP